MKKEYLKRVKSNVCSLFSEYKSVIWKYIYQKPLTQYFFIT